MDTLYQFVIDILTKRVPVESPSVKLDQIVSKIVLIDLPEGVYHEDTIEKVMKPAEAPAEGAEAQPPAEGEQAMQEEEIKHEKNTDEKAVIIIKVPQVEEEEEVQNEDGEKTEIIKKMVDEDQKDQAIVIQGRDIQGIKIVEAKQFYAINTYAGKMYREDFLNFISKQYPEFFDDNNDYDDILQGSHDMAQTDIDKFVKKTCGEYEMPCMDFEVHAPDLA